MAALFRHLRLFALLLLVAGLGVRGAVPAGYMVDTADNGGIIIRICGDGAGSLMRLDPEAGTLEKLPDDFDPHAPADTDASDTSTCPFALTAAFDLPHTPPALPAPAERQPLCPAAHPAAHRHPPACARAAPLRLI